MFWHVSVVVVAQRPVRVVGIVQGESPPEHAGSNGSADYFPGGARPAIRVVGYGLRVDGGVAPEPCRAHHFGSGSISARGGIA